MELTVFELYDYDECTRTCELKVFFFGWSTRDCKNRERKEKWEKDKKRWIQLNAIIDKELSDYMH